MKVLEAMDSISDKMHETIILTILPNANTILHHVCRNLKVLTFLYDFSDEKLNKER